MSYIISMQVKRGFEKIKPIWDVLNTDDQPRGYIAGGYAAFMLRNQIRFVPNDVDIFAVSNDAIGDINRGLMGLGYALDEPVSEIVTRFTPTTRSPIQSPVQVIQPHPHWSDFPMDIVQSFDLSICRAVVTTSDCGFADMDIHEANGRVLTINNPLRTLKRLVKYQQRGVQFDDQELIKLFLAWDNMTPDQQDSLIADSLPDDQTPDELDDYDYQFSWDDHFFSE